MLAPFSLLPEETGGIIGEIDKSKEKTE